MNTTVATLNRVPERSLSTAWQVVEGELVLLRLKHDQLLGLNEVARRIWELCDGTRTIAQIAEALAQEFDVSIEVAAADSGRFIDELATMAVISFRDLPS